MCVCVPRDGILRQIVDQTSWSTFSLCVYECVGVCVWSVDRGVDYGAVGLLQKVLFLSLCICACVFVCVCVCVFVCVCVCDSSVPACG